MGCSTLAMATSASVGRSVTRNVRDARVSSSASSLLCRRCSASASAAARCSAVNSNLFSSVSTRTMVPRSPWHSSNHCHTRPHETALHGVSTAPRPACRCTSQ